jgi:hypothetical protein
MSNTSDISVLVEVAALALAILVAWYILRIAFLISLESLGVAGRLFSLASESGFIGVALYVILWVIAFPVMLFICIAGGIVRILLQAFPEEGDR